MQVVLTKSGFEKASLGTASMLSYNFQWPQPAVEVCAGLAALCTPTASPLPSPPLPCPLAGVSSSAAVLGHWVDHCRESLEVFCREEAMSCGVPPPRARVTDVLSTLHSVVSLVAALQERQDQGGPDHVGCHVHIDTRPTHPPMQYRRCGPTCASCIPHWSHVCRVTRGRSEMHSGQLCCSSLSS